MLKGYQSRRMRWTAWSAEIDSDISAFNLQSTNPEDFIHESLAADLSRDNSRGSIIRTVPNSLALLPIFGRLSA